MKSSVSYVRVFASSCVATVALASTAFAQQQAPQPAQASTPRVATRTDTGQRVAIVPVDSAQSLATGAYGYSVVLVLGDMTAAGSGDGNVPAAARKALTDMKDFLPYKSYRLLDAQWILGTARAITRLRGPNEQEYELALGGSITNGKLRVQFRLEEPLVATNEVALSAARESMAARNNETAERMAMLQQLQRQAEAAEADAARARQSQGAASADAKAAADREAASRAKLSAMRREVEMMLPKVARGHGTAIIDTGFTMDIGETVVVGTSRVRGGDKALIALLTVVPRGAASEKKE